MDTVAYGHILLLSTKQNPFLIGSSTVGDVGRKQQQDILLMENRRQTVLRTS